MKKITFTFYAVLMLGLSSCGGCYGAQGDQGATEKEPENTENYDEEDAVTGNGSNEESTGGEQNQQGSQNSNQPHSNVKGTRWLNAKSIDSTGNLNPASTNDNNQNDR